MYSPTLAWGPKTPPRRQDNKKEGHRPKEAHHSVLIFLVLSISVTSKICHGDIVKEDQKPIIKTSRTEPQRLRTGSRSLVLDYIGFIHTWRSCWRSKERTKPCSSWVNMTCGKGCEELSHSKRRRRTTLNHYFHMTLQLHDKRTWMWRLFTIYLSRVSRYMFSGRLEVLCPVRPSIVSVRPFLLLPFLWEEGTEETIRDGYVTRNPTAWR